MENLNWNWKTGLVLIVAIVIGLVYLNDLDQKSRQVLQEESYQSGYYDGYRDGLSDVESGEAELDYRDFIPQ